jgi:hypothetical protein
MKEYVIGRVTVAYSDVAHEAMFVAEIELSLALTSATNVSEGFERRTIA